MSMADTLKISTFPDTKYASSDQKIPLVMIHGWGLNSAVWQPLIESLPENFTDIFNIITIDLPGFGINVNQDISPYSIENICQYINRTIAKPAVYLGWSLGGVVTTEMALAYPDKVLALVTVASSPRFLEEAAEQQSHKEMWPGIKLSVLDSFHQQLHVDTKKTISGFLKIQAMGSPHIRKDIKQISDLVFQHQMASKLTLDRSLNLLESSDYRARLKDISQPFMRMYGDADSLVPKKVIDKISELAKSSEFHIFSKASHAPFISHTDDFKQILLTWLIQKAKANFT